MFLKNVLEDVVYEQLLAIDVQRYFFCEKTAYTSISGHPFIYLGGFHLHLLVFPFVYQFNSRIEVLVHSSFVND